MPKGMNGWI